MLRVGDLVTFISYACKSRPHNYASAEPVILVLGPVDPDRSDIVLILRRGKTELTHLRFLESLM